ncbi:MAG TPA: hypothetical protein VK763_19605 [Terriglobales bacterium]|nr:hypothetical protein [Terriglobales bacterium]
MSKPRVVHLGKILVCTLFLCALALAAEQKSPTKLSDLPAEAQQALSAALARNSAGIQNFTLTASDGVDRADFGISVAIDGNTVVVGAVNGDQDLGAAYVFTKPASGWTDMTQTAELTASDAQSGDAVGYGVAISGNTIVVGAHGATVNGNRYQGAAYVFVMPANGWTNMTQTAKLTASDGSSDSDFGVATAINGNTIVVGAPFPNGVGTAYVFVMPSGGWTNMTQTAELTASDGTDGEDFGGSVSVSGNVVLVGASDGSSQRPGAAYLFVEPSNGWMNATETAELTASDGAIGDEFGQSVSLSGDTAVVGAPNHGGVGAGVVYVFVELPSGWVNMTQTAGLTVSRDTQTCFGDSVSIVGQVILAGAQCINEFKGAAYVFVKPASGWRNSSNYKLKLSIPFSLQTDYFGASVAISGTTGIVGAPYAPTSLPCPSGVCQAGPGEAFVFTEK